PRRLLLLLVHPPTLFSPTHYTLLPLLFNAPATPETYTLSLHDALPISTGNKPPFTGILFSRPSCGIPTTTSKPEPASSTINSMRSSGSCPLTGQRSSRAYTENTHTSSSKHLT